MESDHTAFWSMIFILSAGTIGTLGGYLCGILQGKKSKRSGK